MRMILDTALRELVQEVVRDELCPVLDELRAVTDALLWSQASSANARRGAQRHRYLAIASPA
jgi:hypothetical protein